MNGFATLINSNQLVLLDFFATWCGPCKMMTPILEQVKKSLGETVRIVKVDVDRNTAAAQQFQVQGVPTLILFRAGKVLWRQSGVVQAQQLISLLRQYSPNVNN